MNTIHRTFRRRALILLGVAFVLASLLIYTQDVLESALGGAGFIGLILLTFGPVVIAGYNNCLAALRSQGLPKNFTDTHR